MTDLVVKLAKRSPKFRRALIAAIEDRWSEFLDQKYQGGEMKIKNPNPETKERYPTVSVSTALKYPPFAKKIRAEFEKWNEEGSESKSKTIDLGELTEEDLSSINKGLRAVKGPAKEAFLDTVETVPDLIDKAVGALSGKDGKFKTLLGMSSAIGSAVGAHLATGPYKEAFDWLAKGSYHKVGNMLTAVKGWEVGVAVGAVTGVMVVGAALLGTIKISDAVRKWVNKRRDTKTAAKADAEFVEALSDYFLDVSPDDLKRAKSLVGKNGSLDPKKAQKEFEKANSAKKE